MRYEIKMILEDFYHFLKKPYEQFNESISIKQKWTILLSILLLDFALVFISGGIISFINSYLIKLDSNPLENSLNNKSIIEILFLVVVLIPFIEELLFRFPLKYERNLLFQFFDYLTKNRTKLFWIKNFRFFFYSFATLFALVHLSNYANNSILFFIIAPIIILPQFIGGLALGYIRLRLGFFWGVLQHGIYNFVVFAPLLLFFNVNTLVDIDNSDFTLQIESLEFGLDNISEIKRYQSEINIDSIIATNYPLKYIAENLNSSDSTLLKSSTLINLRYINKTNSKDPNELILIELIKEFNSKE